MVADDRCCRGFARNAATLTIARIGVGVGEASATPCAYSLIADRFPAGVRGTALGIYSAGLFAGSGLSLLIGGSIVRGLFFFFFFFFFGTVPGRMARPLGLVELPSRPYRRGPAGAGIGGVGLFVARTRARGAGRHSRRGRCPPMARFGEQLVQLLPPLTLFDAARRGPRALAINLAGAAVIGACSFLLAEITGNGPQFLFLGIGFYAVFSWACALREREPATFALTWASPAFMGIVIAYAADCFLGYAVSYWGAPYVEREFAVDKATLGLMIGAPGALGGFIGAVFGGKLADMLEARFAGGRILGAGHSAGAVGSDHAGRFQHRQRHSILRAGVRIPVRHGERHRCSGGGEPIACAAAHAGTLRPGYSSSARRCLALAWGHSWPAMFRRSPATSPSGSNRRLSRYRSGWSRCSLRSAAPKAAATLLGERERPGNRFRRRSARRGQHPVARIAGRVGLVIVRIGMDDDCAAILVEDRREHFFARSGERRGHAAAP